jgi:hypothetical protein
MWNEIRQKKSKALYFIDFDFQRALFSFSQQREPGFLVFGFQFPVSTLLLCVCVCMCVYACMIWQLRTGRNGGGHPPISFSLFIFTTYNELFFPHLTVAKNHHAPKTNKSIDLNSSFSILREIIIMFGYKNRCLKYFLGVKQCSDFLPHLCLKIIFFWLYTV